MIANPALLRRSLLLRNPASPFERRLSYDAFARPHYAYGVYHAAVEAQSLGYEAISVIEFGVAGGAGLRELVKVARDVNAVTGLRIETFGFDSGRGMPRPTGNRDLPYAWATGLFRMPKPIRQGDIEGATLILGDVRETVDRFARRADAPPVGFIAIDVDYYCSTVGVLKLFEGSSAEINPRLLPRVFCYLDDCIGDDHELHCEHAGELLAVREFNDNHADRKIAPIFGLRHKRRIPAPWNDVMFVAHLFDHPRYGSYTNPRWKVPERRDTISPVVIASKPAAESAVTA